jgi:hypothetical protein
LRHNLKIEPRWLDAVKSGAKKVEIRKADRPFKVGDELVVYLQDYSDGVLACVTHVLPLGDVPGCSCPGYAALSIDVLQLLEGVTAVTEALSTGDFG